MGSLNKSNNDTGDMRQSLFAELSSVKAWIIILLYLVFMTSLAIFLKQYVDPEILSSFLETKGLTGIFLFVLIEVFFVIFVPIYNTPLHIASGFIFGGMLGWLINFISVTIGLSLIILMVKVYGRPLIERIVPYAVLARYDHLSHKIGPITLFIIYVLPIFPDDELTYLIAAGKGIPFWRYFLPIFLGNITKSAMSFIGDSGLQGLGIAMGTRIIILVIGLFIIGFQEYIVLKRLGNRKSSI